MSAPSGCLLPRAEAQRPIRPLRTIASPTPLPALSLFHLGVLGIWRRRPCELRSGGAGELEAHGEPWTGVGRTGQGARLGLVPRGPRGAPADPRVYPVNGDGRKGDRSGVGASWHCSKTTGAQDREEQRTSFAGNPSSQDLARGWGVSLLSSRGPCTNQARRWWPANCRQTPRPGTTVLRPSP